MEFKKCDGLDIPDSGLHRGIRTAAGAKTSTVVKGITTKGADKETHLCFVTHVAYRLKSAGLTGSEWVSSGRIESGDVLEIVN